MNQHETVFDVILNNQAAIMVALKHMTQLEYVGVELNDRLRETWKVLGERERATDPPKPRTFFDTPT
jgi:hypothetical protein